MAGRFRFRASSIGAAVRQLALSYTDFTTGPLPAPFSSINRGGLATQIGATGLVEYGLHNLLKRSRDAAETSPWSNWGGTATTGAPGDQVITLTNTDANAPRWQETNAGDGGPLSIVVALSAGTAVTPTVGLYSPTGWQEVTAAIVSGPGAVASASLGRVSVSGLQTGVKTYVRLTRASAPAGVYAVAIYPNIGGGTAGLTLGFHGAYMMRGVPASTVDLVDNDSATAVFLPRLTHDPKFTGELGPELVSVEADRTFASDTGWWTKGGAASIGSGKCTLATGSSIQRLSLTTIGKYYVVECDLTVRSGALYLTGYYSATNSSTSGHKKFYIYATTGTFRVAVDSGDVDIDNISVREMEEYTVSEVLGANVASAVAIPWTGNGTVSHSAGEYTCVCTTNGNYGLSFGGISTNGKSYLLEFEIVSNSAPRAVFGWASANGGAVAASTTVGAKRGIILATTGSSVFGVLGGVAGESFVIRNISVREYLGTQIDGGKVPKRLGLLVEGQATDTAQDAGLNVQVAAAQSRTVTATAWTVSFHGLGTVTLSGAHTATITGTSLNRKTALTFTPSAGALTMTPSGDVKNLDCVNQAYASSTIVNTTTGSVVRAADTDIISGTEFAAKFGDGSDFVAVFDVTPWGAVTGRIAEFAGSSDRLVTTGLIAFTPSLVQFFVPPGTLVGSFSAVSAIGARSKIAIAYSANNMRVSVNGGAVLSDLSGAVTGPLGRLALGMDVNGGQRQDLIVHGYGGIPGAGSTMSDAALQALSAL